MATYAKEFKAKVLDFHFANPKVSANQMVKMFDLPEGTIRRWINADPRHESKVKRYSDEEKEGFVCYALEHPEMTLDEISSAVGVKLTTLANWLLRDPRYERRNSTFQERERSAAFAYWRSHPKATLEEIALVLGVEEQTALRWLQCNPECMEASRSLYSDEDKAAVLDWYYETPGALYPEVYEKFGYPLECIFRLWVEEDHRRGMKNTYGFTVEQMRPVCLYYMENEGVTLQAAIDKFGYPEHPSVLSDWCVLLYGMENKVTGENQSQRYLDAVEEVLAHPETTIADAAERAGLDKEKLRRILNVDPRWANAPGCRPAKGSPYADRAADVVEFYFSNPHLTMSQISAHFGGRPHSNTIAVWVRNDPRFGDPAVYGCTEAQKKLVLDYHYAHLREHVGKIESALGFPVPRRAYKEWLVLDPREKGRRGSKSKGAGCSFFEKADVVLLALEEGLSSKGAAERCGLNHMTVKGWLTKYRKAGLIGLVSNKDLPKKKTVRIVGPPASGDPSKMGPEDIRKLMDENAALRARNKELEFENDVCNAIFETLKKDPGLSGEKLLSNREKTLVINALRLKRYKLAPLLRRFGISKSSYEYQRDALGRPDKYAGVRAALHDAYERSGHAYGYRRLTALLRLPLVAEDEGGIPGYGMVIDEKVVLRLAQEEGLVTLPAKKMEKYNSYPGPVGETAPNLLSGDFSSDEPGRKLLTDVTEFHLNNYKVYLSPVLDCFNGEIVSWTISRSPNLEMVKTMLQGAIEKVGRSRQTIIHSDQGWAYRHDAYRKMLKEAGWTQSMSRKGYSPDNSAMEGFFGRLKNEFFYNHDFTGYPPEQFMAALDGWIRWHNLLRIKETLGYTSPVLYRKSWEREREELASAA